MRYEVNAVMEGQGGSPRAFARVRVRWPFARLRCNFRAAALMSPGPCVLALKEQVALRPAKLLQSTTTDCAPVHVIRLLWLLLRP